MLDEADLNKEFTLRVKFAGQAYSRMQSWKTN